MNAIFNVQLGTIQVLKYAQENRNSLRTGDPENSGLSSMQLCQLDSFQWKWTRALTWGSIVGHSSDSPETLAGTLRWRSLEAVEASQPWNLGRFGAACLAGRQTPSIVYESAWNHPTMHCKHKPNYCSCASRYLPAESPRWCSRLQMPQCQFCFH